MLASGAAWAQTGPTIDRLKQAGTVKVGITDEYPMAFRQPDGTLGGNDYEIATQVFAKLGVKVEPVVLGWGELIPALKAHRIDVAAAGMFIKPERCKQVAFANPDYQSIDTLVVLKGNPKNLHSFADVVKNPAIKVGVTQGGASALLVKRAGIPAAQTQAFPGVIELIAALTTGRIDAMSIDTVLASKYLATNAGTIERAEPFEVQVVDGKPLRSYGAFVFRPEDKDLIEAFDGYLASYVGSPAHVALLKKYGMTADEVPPHEATAEALCQG